MQIVHVYKDSWPPVRGGIEQHVTQLAIAQHARGHEVGIIVAGAQGATERLDHDGVCITRLPEHGRFASSPLTAAFWPALKRVRADVVHFHHPNPIAEIAEPMLARDSRRVVTYHADITRQRVLGLAYAPLRRRFLQRMDAVIVSNPRLLASSRVLRAHRERALVVPYGVEPARRRPRSEREPGRLLFVGRLREYKGLPVLIEALSQLEAPLHLSIVGDGPMEDALRLQVSELGLDSRVEFLGEVDDLQLDDEYGRARALVLPSTRRAEAFGIVLAEALARGTPLLTTELGTGTSWVNRDGVTGLVVAPGDAGALAEAAHRLAHDDALWDRLADGAHERSEVFSPEAMTTATLAAYDPPA